MTDINCLQCQASISTIQGGNVYACGHLLCANCGAESKCRRDGSYTIIQEEEVILSVHSIQDICEKLKSEGEAADWSLYYATLEQFRELITRKCSQTCQEGHRYYGEMCRTCGEAAEQKEVCSYPETPRYCQFCNAPIGSIGVCPFCALQHQTKAEQRHCGQCGQKSEGEVCWDCQQRGAFASQSVAENQELVTPVSIAQPEQRRCGQCGQKSDGEVCCNCQKRRHTMYIISKRSSEPKASLYGSV